MDMGKGDELLDSSNSCNSNCKWSREEDEAFESALTIYTEDETDRWEKIADHLPGKTAEDVKHHYQLLVDDVNLIESGAVPLPPYNSSSSSSSSSSISTKGKPWTEEERNLFVKGLGKLGKGNWKGISRSFVKTKTPKQVSDYAYRLERKQRLERNNKEI